MQSGVQAGSPLVMYSENASVYQPCSRFAAEAAVPAQHEAVEAAAAGAPVQESGVEVQVMAAAWREAAPMEGDAPSGHQKGVSAPAIMTTQSWPELIREAQQLAGPVGGELAMQPES